MLGGLYGDLPPPSSTADENPTTTSTTNVWSSSAKMAPSTLRKPFAPPQTILRPRPPQSKPVPPSSANKQAVVAKPADENRNPNPSAAVFQPALVGVTSSVQEEYDPARPNDYEEYRRDRKRKQAEAEVRRELEERERKEREREERERREREKDIGGVARWYAEIAFSTAECEWRGRRICRDRFLTELSSFS